MDQVGNLVAPSIVFQNANSMFFGINIKLPLRPIKLRKYIFELNLVFKFLYKIE
jgi:hypothetical protein